MPHSFIHSVIHSFTHQAGYLHPVFSWVCFPIRYSLFQHSIFYDVLLW